MDEKDFEQELARLKSRVLKKEKNVNTSIKLFEDKRVRTAWNEDEEDWYFSIIDVCEILSGSSEPRRYWSDLKSKLKNEGGHLYKSYS